MVADNALARYRGPVMNVWQDMVCTSVCYISSLVWQHVIAHYAAKGFLVVALFP